MSNTEKQIITNLDNLLLVFKDIRVEDLLQTADTLCFQGYRLVQICGSVVPDSPETPELNGKVEMIYSFDKDYEMVNLRFIADQRVEIPSISRVYLAAFLYENEIAELFGMKIINIAIDYKGHLYKKAAAHPFAAQNPARPKQGA